MHRKSLFAALLAAVLAACNGTDTTFNPLADGGIGPAVHSFNATPANLALGGGDVLLSWSTSGATNLSIDQGVGDVTSITSNSKTVQVTSSKTFTLTARSAAGSTTRQVSVTVTNSGVVSGKVVDRFGHPIANAPVTVGGRPSVNTDANGRFSVSGVTTPYDVAIINAADKIGTLYKGLNRADPTLFYYTTSTPLPHATVSGKVTGGSYPQPAQHVTRIAFVSPDVVWSSTTDISGNYNFDAHWFGPMATAGAVHAIQIRESGPNIPAEYKGYGKRDLTLSNGGSFSNQDITLGTVSAAPLSGSVSSPSGYAVSGKELDAVIGSIPALSLAYDGSAATTFSYLAPNIPNSSLIFAAAARKTGVATGVVIRAGLAPGATGVNVAVPAGPEATLPIDGATGINTASTFSWTPFVGGVHLVLFSPVAPGKPHYLVVTTGTATSVPDFASAGLGLPSATAYTWQVQAIGPLGDIDVATGPSGLVAALNYRLPGDEIIGYMDSRGFTTAP
jgi:hypothetical protein